jgi:hypothetical protein
MLRNDLFIIAYGCLAHIERIAQLYDSLLLQAYYGSSTHRNIQKKTFDLEFQEMKPESWTEQSLVLDLYKLLRKY